MKKISVVYSGIFRYKKQCTLIFKNLFLFSFLAEATIDFKFVHGKCSVICGEDVSIDELQKEVPDKFYFLEVTVFVSSISFATEESIFKLVSKKSCQVSSNLFRCTSDSEREMKLTSLYTSSSHTGWVLPSGIMNGFKGAVIGLFCNGLFY